LNTDSHFAILGFQRKTHQKHTPKQILLRRVENLLLFVFPFQRLVTSRQTLLPDDLGNSAGVKKNHARLAFGVSGMALPKLI
jgi:hypothetical protein